MRQAHGFRVVGLERGGQVPIELHGVIDESADLSFLGQLRGRVQLLLKGVTRINSFGVRCWVDGLRKVPSDTQVELVAVPSAMIDQANLVHDFLGRTKMISYITEFECRACDKTRDVEVTIEATRRAGNRFPPTPCPSCGKPMESSEDEDFFLSFLKDQR